MTTQPPSLFSRFRPALWWIWPLAVVGLLALQLWFPDSGTGVLHDTYSPTAEGQRAFYRLVEEYSDYTDRNLQPLSRALPQQFIEPTLCILGPERWPTTAEWNAIFDWVGEGGQLLFAFRGFEEQTIPLIDVRYVPRKGTEPPDDSLPPVTDLVDSQAVAWWTDGRLVAPNADVLVEYDDKVQAVAGEFGDGRYVICATSLVFSNQLLTYGDNAALALRLLEQASWLDGVTFDESLNATGAPKAVGLLLDRELRPLTLQLILLTLLYGWWNFRRFGPLLQPEVGGRHNIVDHTDTLGVAYWRSHDGADVLRAFVKLVTNDLSLNRQSPMTSGRLDAAAKRLNVTTKSLLDDIRRAETVAEQGNVERRLAAGLIRRLARIRTAVR